MRRVSFGLSRLKSVLNDLIWLRSIISEFPTAVRNFLGPKLILRNKPLPGRGTLGQKPVIRYRYNIPLTQSMIYSSDWSLNIIIVHRSFTASSHIVRWRDQTDVIGHNYLNMYITRGFHLIHIAVNMLSCTRPTLILRVGGGNMVSETFFKSTRVWYFVLISLFSLFFIQRYIFQKC